MSNENGLVAITGGAADAGAIVWWSLNGVVEVVAVHSALEGIGVASSDLPLPPTPRKALYRGADTAAKGDVFKRLHQGKVLLCRCVPGRDEVEVLATGDVTPECEYTVTAPYHAELADMWLNAAKQAALSLSTTDVSNWLVGHARSVGAVRLRESGGFYFIPRGTALVEWRQVVGALRECTGHVYSEIPAMRSDEALDAVVRALTTEVDEQVAHMRQEVQEMERFTSRSAEARIRRADSILGKVSQYESSLGIHLGALRESVKDVKLLVTTERIQQHAAMFDEMGVPQ